MKSEHEPNQASQGSGHVAAATIDECHACLLRRFHQTGACLFGREPTAKLKHRLHLESDAAPIFWPYDRFAVALLKQAEVAENLADKIAAGVFVAQWIWVKHRLGYG